MKSINPYTGALIREYTPHSAEQVDTAIAKAHGAFKAWRTTDFAHRSRLIHSLAGLLRAEAEQHALLMVQEMGKPIAEAKAEIEKCAWVCEYYADNAATMLADEAIKTDSSQSVITYQPIGLVLAVMPWNFPFWQVLRFAAPALMAGNGAVLKHASNVSGCALTIENLFQKAGFPEHLFTTLLVPGKEVGAIIEHPHIAAVTLTGSVEAGRAVAAKAGACLKKTVLELGGSDPYIILEDADIALAATACTTSRLINNGQSCIAAKRFIVVDAVYDAFLEAFTREMQQRVMGDPADPATTLGPQVSIESRNQLYSQVIESVNYGAIIKLGGVIGEGSFYPPTILTNVIPGMPAYDEELFGPVASVIRATDETDALRIANDSRFGLGGAIFTQDIAKGTRLARESLHSGCVAVNGLVKSDPRLPFGGIKESGYGRELGSVGIREFVNIKSVVVA